MKKIAIIGLGYVGLPLARLFATKYVVIGFDINEKRIQELNSGHDSTLEVEDAILQNVLVNNLSDSSGLYCKSELAVSGADNEILLVTKMKELIPEFLSKNSEYESIDKAKIIAI